MHGRCTTAFIAILAIVFIPVCLAAAAETATGEKSPSVRPIGNVHIPDANSLKDADPFSLLHDRPMSDNHVLIPLLLTSANSVSPKYIYELARRLWVTDKPSAMEWLAVGMIRARYDALRCLDKSAQQGITFLGSIAPDVMTGIREDRRAFSEAGRRALERSDLYASSVPPIWICSHGVKMISAAIEGKKTAETEWLKPTAEWPSLRTEVSTELARYFEDQGRLPNEPAASNRETLSAILSTGTGVASSKFDPTFGQHGLFKMSIDGKRIFAKDSVVQPDGKIVVAVTLSDKKYAGSTALVRLKPNGTLDDQFGAGGVVSSKIGINSRPEKIALLPNGKIVVAGWAHVNSENEGITVTRYNSDGSLDEGFANHGTLIFPKGHWSYVMALVIQPDEKIVVGGSITIREQHTTGGFVSYRPHELFFLARINKNGFLDADFGDKGLVATDVGGGGKVSSLAIQTDGKVVAAGTGRRDSASPMIVARYSETGSLDKNFGNKGLVIQEIQNTRYAAPSISVLSDGRLLVGYGLEKEILLTRLLANGQIDSGFAQGGHRKVTIGPLTHYVPPLLMGDDKVLLSGLVVRPPTAGKSQPPYYYSMGLARFLSNGVGDAGFGPDGIQMVSIGSVTDHVASVMAPGNGRIVLVGSSDDETNSYLVLLGFVP